MAKNDSVNDRMIKWTALPAVYLWLAASGAVVAMGILKPEVVLENLEGFIALIAIIGGTAQPAFATMLELWKNEQQTEVDLHPTIVTAKEDAIKQQAEHERLLAVKQQEHEHILAAERQKVELGIISTDPKPKKVLKPKGESDD
jgi:hypothetical protein